MKPIIVVIDSGIDAMIVENETRDILNKGQYDKCGHGTACAMVIKSIVPTANIISIPLLDESARATSDELEYVLEYCCEVNCHIVNLSLSVSNLHTRKLEKICNQLKTQGKVIVSSVTNRELTSIPANYDTVLGVRGKVFSSPFTYWFNNRREIQLITDMTPIFTDFRLNRYFMFSGNSKAAAVASGLIGSYFSNEFVENSRELIHYMEKKRAKSNWGKLTLKSQLGEILAPTVIEERELKTIREKIYPLIKKYIMLDQEFSENDVLFDLGMITEITVQELFKGLSELFEIEVNLQNMMPKDIVSINNIAIAIKRICSEQGRRYV